MYVWMASVAAIDTTDIMYTIQYSIQSILKQYIWIVSILTPDKIEPVLQCSRQTKFKTELILCLMHRHNSRISSNMICGWQKCSPFNLDNFIVRAQYEILGTCYFVAYCIVGQCCHDSMCLTICALNGCWIFLLKCYQLNRLAWCLPEANYPENAQIIRQLGNNSQGYYYQTVCLSAGWGWVIWSQDMPPPASAEE